MQAHAGDEQRDIAAFRRHAPSRLSFNLKQAPFTRPGRMNGAFFVRSAGRIHWWAKVPYEPGRRNLLARPALLIYRKKIVSVWWFFSVSNALTVAAKVRRENQEENVMKNLFTAVMLGIALAGVALAHISPEEKTGERQAAVAAKVKVAVVEFSPASNASGMTPEAKRQLQASLAFALFKSDRFDVVDVRRTRDASQGDLAALNSGSSTAAAVKLGKQLGVSYVLTGTVVEYTPQGADGFGRVILKTRLIEVATGKIKHTGETTQLSTSAMRTNGAAEMQTKTLKPAIEKLKETLLGLRL